LKQTRVSRSATAVVSGIAMNTAVVVDEMGRATLVSASEFGRAPMRIVVAYGL
jgi:hypothetical protein